MAGPGPGAEGPRAEQSFDHLPARYDRLTALTGAEVRAWLMFGLPPRGDRAVDLGCGTGILTRMLAERFADVLAVDVSAPMLEFARSRRPEPNIAFQHRDLHQLSPVVDGQFDLVFCAHVLRYLPDPEAALRLMRSLVRPGGQLMLVDAVEPITGDSGGVGHLHVTRPRAALQLQALRTFWIELIRRRRPVGEAVELLHLQLDSDWLDHQVAGRLQPAAQWEAGCRTVLPGASIRSLDGARALVWTSDHPLAVSVRGIQEPPD